MRMAQYYVMFVHKQKNGTSESSGACLNRLVPDSARQGQEVVARTGPSVASEPRAREVGVGPEGTLRAEDVTLMGGEVVRSMVPFGINRQALVGSFRELHREAH